MDKKHNLRVLISGGGTGGHIFPALAIANALKRHNPDAEILFVGAENRMEMERVPAAGYRIVGLPVRGFDRKRLWRNVKVMLCLWKSMRMARKIIRDFNPDVAVGVGGYVSGPVLKAAQKRGIPTIIQEQNSYAGVTNKLLARNASAICVAYDRMERFFPEEKIIKTGNPVRADIADATCSPEEAKRQLGFDPSRPLVVVVGGSLGARVINDSMKLALKKIVDAGASVLWQTGKLYADECRRTAEGTDNAIATAFVSRMDLAYHAADLIVSRAGASTISELQIIGVPAILVPSPNVAEDHQRKNAQALVDVDAAVMLLDAECKARLTDTVISLLNDKKRRDTLATNVKKMAMRSADDKIVEIIDNLLKK